MAAVGQYLQTRLLDDVFGNTAYSVPATLYIGVSTQVWSSTVTDAQLLAGEPTATGGYARIAVTNNTTNFPAATGSNPATKKLHIAQSFPVSTAAWSTGATALQSVFIADASTLAGGNVLWSGALIPPTDIVNGTGVTFTFNVDALSLTLT